MANYDPEIVLEFYANAWPTEEGVRDMRSWVRGQWIPFGTDALSQFLGHPLILEEDHQCEFNQRRDQASGFDEEASPSCCAYRGKTLPGPLRGGGCGLCAPA